MGNSISTRTQSRVNPLQTLEDQELKTLFEASSDLSAKMAKGSFPKTEHLGKSGGQRVWKISAHSKDRIYFSTGKKGTRIEQGSLCVIDEGVHSISLEPCSILRIRAENSECFDFIEKDKVKYELLSIPEKKFNLASAYYLGKHEGKKHRKFELVLPLITGTLTKPKPNLEYVDKLVIASDLVACLKNIHSINVVHRHINAQSCLLFEDESILRGKLSNFQYSAEGLGVRSFSENYMHSAPEAVKNFLRNQYAFSDPREAKQGDVFALGLVLYELFHGKAHPYTQQAPWIEKQVKRVESFINSQLAIHSRQKSSAVRDFDRLNNDMCNELEQELKNLFSKTIDDQKHPEISALISSMTSIDPSDRPSIIEVQEKLQKLIISIVQK